jgi:hypothetical protein
MYDHQAHQMRLQHHMSSAAQSYGREFRAVDDRVAGYLGRFLRRAKQGPEQERQLLQVIQVEIRDLLRRTLDSESEVLHLTDLLKESHARVAHLTANADQHLEKILQQHEARFRDQKMKVSGVRVKKKGRTCPAAGANNRSSKTGGRSGRQQHHSLAHILLYPPAPLPPTLTHYIARSTPTRRRRSWRCRPSSRWRSWSWRRSWRSPSPR